MQSITPSSAPGELPGDSGRAKAGITPSDTERPLRHIQELDGIRGVAILLILVHHFFTISYPHTKLDWVVALGVRPLWVGVDLFFVLSGFLITRILVYKAGKPRYLRNFYARRSLRIFPLYYASLVIFLFLLPLMPWSGFDAYREIPREQREYFFFYLINYFIPESGTLGNLTHFWSLCVEEHFYLIWPLLVLIAPRKVFRVALAGIVFVIALRIVAMQADWPASWSYHATHSRIDALLMGALTSQVYAKVTVPGRRTRAILWAIMLVSGATFFYAGLVWNVRGSGIGPIVAMPPLNLMWSCFLLLVLWNGFHSKLSRLFRGRILRAAGKYSYGLYIFHWPALYLATYLLYGSAMAPNGPDGRFPATASAALLATVVMLVLAITSWNLLEKPCLGLKRYFER